MAKKPSKGSGDRGAAQLEAKRLVNKHAKFVATRLVLLPKERTSLILVKTVAALHQIEPLHPWKGTPTTVVVRRHFQKCIDCPVSMREVYELATRGMRHPSVDELVIANLDAMVVDAMPEDVQRPSLVQGVTQAIE